MNTLIQNLEKATNFTETENGALTNKSTLSNLVDFFGLGAAMRNRSDSDIISLFSKAFAEDKLLALKTLFYIRDARGGQGERRVFRVILKWLGENYPEVVIKNLDIIPEFGRWDDMFVLENTKVWNEVLELVNNEFNILLQNDHPTLFAKWCPSINTSSEKTKKLARKICKHLGMTEKQYRKILSKARADLNVVEKQMCSNEWDGIDYPSVPSKASLVYKDAFSKHDGKRYAQYIEDVKSGKAKINASVTYPYEIVERILYKNDESETLDVIWKSLPNYMDGNAHSGIVVADVSGSMSGLPMAVSISLAMYFAERNKGDFANKFITFSETPNLETIVGNNIREKVKNLSSADWGMNTNLQSVFDLILDVAVKNKVAQSEMPNTIYIVSDMEFDVACQDNKKTNYELINHKYEEFGYKRPNLVFWNVNAMTNQSPIAKDDKGTCLVSGCSPAILKTLLAGGEITAYDVMMDTITKDRYNNIII
jgi:hypothetical protein